MPIKTANTKLLHNKWQRFLLVTNVIRFNHRSDIPIATCDKRHFWQEIAICRHCYAWHVMSGFRTFNLMILGTWPLYAILLRYSDNQKSLGLRSCDLYGHAMRNTRLMIRLFTRDFAPEVWRGALSWMRMLQPTHPLPCNCWITKFVKTWYKKLPTEATRSIFWEKLQKIPRVVSFGILFSL